MPRRTPALLAVTTLLLSLVVVPAVGDEPAPATPGSIACAEGAPPAGFADVTPGSVHAAAIDCVTSLGIVAGTSATSFSPATTLTRGQLASLLVGALRHLGITLPELASSTGFPDGGTTHGDNAARLAAAGIVRGFGDDTFRPEVAVTRAQFASTIVNTLTYVRNLETSSDAPAGFDDVPAGATHGAAIAAAVAAGLFRGVDAATFAPGEATRRDQAATVLTRLLDVADAAVVGEVWSLDQGTDLIHVYDARGEQAIAEIDVSPAALAAAGFDAPEAALTVPHMIEFDSRERYAFVASTAGGVTIVIDTRTKQVAEVLATGAGTHMAAVTPDDSAVWVAAIAAGALVEIPLDLDVEEPTFEIGRTLDVETLLDPIEESKGYEYPSYQPVCHQYSTDSSEAWVTLGPGWSQGGAFVLDLATGTVVEGFDPEVVKANCGVSVTDQHAVLNYSGQVVADDYTDGETYVFDVRTRELLTTLTIEGGYDVHGLRLTPDGSAYWQVNRVTDDAVVIDATTFEIIARHDGVADTPDILDFSPDGSLVYISQRGPSPRSGAIHAAAGQQPGVAVVDAATGERLRVLEPAEVRETPDVDHPEGRILNDVHGVGVRARGTGEVLGGDVAPAVVVRTATTGADQVTFREAVAVGGAPAFTCKLPREA